jgi:hypothetical protein
MMTENPRRSQRLTRASQSTQEGDAAVASEGNETSSSDDDTDAMEVRRKARKAQNQRNYYHRCVTLFEILSAWDYSLTSTIGTGQNSGRKPNRKWLSKGFVYTV